MHMVKDISRVPGWASRIILLGYFYSLLFLITTSLREMLAVSVIEVMIIFLVVHPLKRYGWGLIFPQYREVFPAFDQKDFLSREAWQQAEILQLLYELPARRAVFMSVATALKFLFLGGIGVYFIQHNMGEGEAWICFILVGVFIAIAYMGLSFIEMQAEFTKLIRELHREHDLSEVFIIYSKLSSKNYFLINEQRCFILGVVIFFIQTFFLFVILPHIFLEKILWMLVMGMIILSRSYLLYKNYLVRGIVELEHTYCNIGEQAGGFVSLASNPMLARFQGAFNELILKLQEYEQRTMTWFVKQTEADRFRIIGEMSALVGHNVKGSIHAVFFSLDEIKERAISDPHILKHLDYIGENTRRIEQLAGDLNRNLRNSNQQKYTDIMCAHEEAVRLLKYEFSKIEQVNFKFVKAQRFQKVLIAQSDMVHILYALYGNALKSIEESQAPSPQIALEFAGANEEFVTYYLRDNGKGMSIKDFTIFTTLNLANMKQGSFRRGLGLRLVKLLMENHGGAINCIDSEETGACLKIVLPSIKNQRQQALLHQYRQQRREQTEEREK